jgi:RNA recognition motif. (a.k.a. RRM, RBD, or RNP domain)
MKADVLGKLNDARDFYALAKGVLSLCEPYGPVHAFRLVHNRGASRVACFIELESPKQQPALARALGTRTLNGEVCLDIPVRKDFGTQGKVVALASPAAAVEPRLPQQPAARAANTQASA